MAGSERGLRLAVGVSLLAHALLLLLPTLGERRGDEQAVLPRKVLLTLRRPQTPFAPVRTGESAGKPASAVRGESVGKKGAPGARARTVETVRIPPTTMDAKASVTIPAAVDEAAAQSTVPPVPLLNLDDLREQARRLGAPLAGTLLRGGRVDTPSPAAGSEPLDQPILRTLSKRLGRPLSVASEQVMADGSRLIRFSGNLCLRIPRHLPAWQENPIGPTMLLPMTCND